MQLQSALGAKTPSAFAAAAKVTVDYLDGRLAVLKLNNPKANQLELPFLEELQHTLGTLESNKEVDGVVITSAVPRVFSAGLDLNELVDAQETSFKKYFRTFQNVFKKLYTSPLLTVAAINGAAPAGGTVLAFGCDYRIGADNPKYTLGLREAAIGIAPPMWLQHLTARTLGPRKAEWDLQLGMMYTPQDGLARGYIDALSPEATVLDAAVSIARAALKTPNEARTTTKQMQRAVFAEAIGDKSADEFWNIVRQPDAQEHIKKLLQGLQKPAKAA